MPSSGFRCEGPGKGIHVGGYMEEDPGARVWVWGSGVGICVGSQVGGSGFGSGPHFQE